MLGTERSLGAGFIPRSIAANGLMLLLTHASGDAVALLFGVLETLSCLFPPLLRRHLGRQDEHCKVVQGCLSYILRVHNFHAVESIDMLITI